MKLKLVNSLVRIILAIVIIGAVSMIFVSNHYLTTNMAYYRIMHRFQNDFHDSFDFMFTIYCAVTFIAVLIGKWKFDLKALHILIFTLLIGANQLSYYFLPDYLNKSVVTLMLFVMLTSALLLICTIKETKYRNIFIMVIALIELIIIAINYI